MPEIGLQISTVRGGIVPFDIVCHDSRKDVEVASAIVGEGPRRGRKREMAAPVATCGYGAAEHDLEPAIAHSRRLPCRVPCWSSPDERVDDRPRQDDVLSRQKVDAVGCGAGDWRRETYEKHVCDMVLILQQPLDKQPFVADLVDLGREDGPRKGRVLHPQLSRTVCLWGVLVDTCVAPLPTPRRLVSIARLGPQWQPARRESHPPRRLIPFPLSFMGRK